MLFDLNVDLTFHDPLTLMDELAILPTRICTCQALFDDADRDYRQQLATISLCALTEPLFPGKKADEPMHAASNEKERDLAIDHAIVSDELFLKLEERRRAALRNLVEAKNSFEAAKLMVQVVCRGDKK